MVLFMGVVLLPELAAWSQEKLPHYTTYCPSTEEMIEKKADFDDPADLMATFNPKTVVPPELWKLMSFDIKEMQKQTAELVGFKSPDVVGKIAPEIKPGKYTYQDLQKYPGLKELFPPVLYDTIKPGAPPLSCNIMDFEIQPTRQLHWSLRLCEETRKNLGKANLDKDGYIIKESWEIGVPFPKPSGPFKANQLYYNFEKGSLAFDNTGYQTGSGTGLDRHLNIDKSSQYVQLWLKYKGRVLLPPFGWFDERAKRNDELKSNSVILLEPRANRGTVTLNYRYDDPEKLDTSMIYVPSLRRVRKMAATDTQDPLGDFSYDDLNHCVQKITPKKYPVKFDVIAEREYLMPASYNCAKGYADSKNGYALRDVQMMRRPCYVLQMKELDPNYIYSKRIFYMDRETFAIYFSEYYDQRGRLYRTQCIPLALEPESAMQVAYGIPCYQLDYIDLHSTISVPAVIPAALDRRDLSMESLIKFGK